MKKQRFAGIFSVLLATAAMAAAPVLPGCGLTIDDIDKGYYTELKNWLMGRDPDLEVGILKCQGTIDWSWLKNKGFDTSKLPMDFKADQYVSARDVLKVLNGQPYWDLLSILMNLAANLKGSTFDLINLIADPKGELRSTLFKQGYDQETIDDIIHHLAIGPDPHCGAWIRSVVPDHLATEEDWKHHQQTSPRSPAFCPLGDEGCPDSPISGGASSSASSGGSSGDS